MGFKMVLLPPNTQADWPEKIRAVVPDCEVSLFDSPEAARGAIVDADAAYGDVVPDLLKRAKRLRWIQAPAAAPPAGYYTPELIDNEVVVTNQREIYNDHIGAHIMAFVLAFARGLHHYLPSQLLRQWRPRGRARHHPPAGSHRPHHRRRRHRQRDGAPLRRLRDDRSGR